MRLYHFTYEQRLTGGTITPSWEDAADRWMTAYDDLKARYTLDDDETEAVRRWLVTFNREADPVSAVLRRLLGEATDD